MKFPEYSSYDGLGLAELVRKKQVTPLELVEACIERIEKHDPTLNAVVVRMDEMAREAAKGVVPEGAFRGVPYLLKDLLTSHAGVTTTSACRAVRDANFVSPRDSELVARYKRAGLICVGKTSCSELGLLNSTESQLYGPTRNPWHTERTPGGSSGGSGAAVAAGIVPIAHGNDIGGSIRIPAACCGLVGLKPTRARNPLGPAFGDVANGLVHEHVLTRTVRDSAAVLDATAGPALGDPYWAPPPKGRFLEAVARHPGQLRIAYSSTSLRDEALHDDCIAAVEAAARLCQDLGHAVEQAGPQLDMDVYANCFGVMFLSNVATTMAALEESLGIKPSEQGFEPFTLATVELGQTISAAVYLRAVTGLQAIAREVAQFFDSYDVWLSPTLGRPPIPFGHLDIRSRDFMAQMKRMLSFAPLCHLANATGQPAISLPLHWNQEGLPIGLHFTGRFGDEETLLSLSAQLEQAAPWKDKRPPIWG